MTPTDATDTTPSSEGGGPSNATLSNLMHEERRFEPPAELAAHANVRPTTYDAGRTRTSSASGQSRPSG